MRKCVKAMLLAMALVTCVPPMTLHAEEVTENVKPATIQMAEEELDAEAAAVISIKDEQVALAGGNPVEIRSMGYALPAFVSMSVLAGLGFILFGNGTLVIRKSESTII